MEALSRDFREGMLYSDDLMHLQKKEELFLEELRWWQMTNLSEARVLYFNAEKKGTT